MKYILSKYTNVISYKNGMLLFNSLNGARSFCYDDKYIQIINELLKGNEIDEKELDDCVKIFCEKKGVNETKKAIGIYDTYRYIFDKALKIVIIPTLACNFRCVYCYENHDSYIINEEFENNLYLVIIDFIKKHDMRLLAIEWFGGEPLLAYNNIIRS